MPPNKPLTPIKNGTIHLVEDDVALATAIGMLVQTEGMQAVHHPSGEAFIRHLAQHKTDAAEMAPACILLDVRMGTCRAWKCLTNSIENTPI